MRTESAAQAMGIKRAPRNFIPNEGTRMRRIYDLLIANKGIPIEISLSTFEKKAGHGAYIERLRDFYGLDIRNLGRRRWVLAGEWFGKTYVDYIAERIGRADA